MRRSLALPILKALALIALLLPAPPARALPEDTLASVVSVLPVWPGRAQGGAGAEPGTAPEGSGVVLAPGLVATAWHVVAPARRIDIRLADGRILPARLGAFDAASDIALLEIDADLPPFEIAPEVGLADPVCAIGNAWGLGLSVTCGVVSATAVTNAGFNPVEHFVQTDAAANPGASGGALVDAEGRLVGMMSSIFASEGETNIGVNFAVSAALLTRVADALAERGDVTYPEPGWRLEVPDRAQLARIAAPVIAAVDPEGPAAVAGLRAGDIVVFIDAMRTRSPRDATAALALVAEGTPEVLVDVERAGEAVTVALPLGARTGAADTSAAPEPIGDCPHPAPVCALRQAVFPVSSFDPVASATRIGERLLVTNRHVVGDRRDVVVHTPDGPRGGRVLASAYAGDLALIEVEGLPEGGRIATLDETALPGPDAVLHAIGADVARQEVRVFAPGGVIAPPAEGAPLGRLHVTARMQPGVSGGALVDAQGRLAGIAAGGGEGRFEAIPLGDLRALLDLRDAPEAEAVTARLGADFAACAAALEGTSPRDALPAALEALARTCSAADNHGQLLETGRLLAMAGAFEEAIALHGRAVAQTPNSVNARVSLLVSLQLAGRFEEMTDHAAQVMALAPDDPQVLRFAIQSGVWGGAPKLAEQGYAALLAADPRQAEAARRFIDNAPPAPARR